MAAPFMASFSAATIVNLMPILDRHSGGGSFGNN
jgi:hypothetical protein